MGITEKDKGEERIKLLLNLTEVLQEIGYLKKWESPHPNYKD